MKTIKKFLVLPIVSESQALTAFGFLAVMWYALIQYLRHTSPETGLLDNSIWQLTLFAVICFLALVYISWVLFQKFWVRIGLPNVQTMVSKFNTLNTWQQLKFYWASYALLLLASLCSLIAVL